MAVPVANIFYLLCYAYGHLNDLTLAPSGTELGERTENLFALVLSRLLRRLLRRGIARRYLDVEQELRGVRGKIQLAPTLSRALLGRGQLSCRYEELSPDIPENWILKSAAAALSHHPRVEAKLRRELAASARLLTEVRDVPLSAVRFEDLAALRPRQDYALALALSRMLKEGALPSEGTEGAPFTAFDRDEARMGELFEGFVRGFLRLELPEAHLLPRRSEWNATGTPSDLRLLPQMVRDIPFALNGARVVVECKFYGSPLVRNIYGGQRLRSEHLYQLFSYLMHEPPTTGGLLLYAAVEEELNHKYAIQGRDITVRSVDLNRPWPEIHDELLGILRGVVENGWRTAS